MSDIWLDTVDDLFIDTADDLFVDVIDLIVVTPVISPVSGKYSALQLITITCATSGASIYWTDDGSTPDSGDNLYSSPFSLISAKTIKAIGIKSSYADSSIASVDYTTLSWEGFNPYCAPPGTDPYTDCDVCVTFDPEDPFDLSAVVDPYADCDSCPTFDPQNPFDLGAIGDPYLDCTLTIEVGCTTDPSTQFNLFGNTSEYIYGAYFDGESLSHIATYNLELMGEIINYQSDICAIVGTGTGTRFYLLDISLTLLSVNDPQVDAGDIRFVDDTFLIDGPTSNKIYFTDDKGAVIEFTDLVKSGGGPEVTPGDSTDTYSQYYDGSVYVSEWQSPVPKMNRVLASDFSLTYRLNGPYTFQFVIYNDIIYSIGGTFGSAVRAHTLDTYTEQWVNGDPSGNGNTTSICESGGFLIAGTIAGLYKFDTDGNTLDSLLGTNYDRLKKINDQFVLAWNGRNMAVYDISGDITLVDTIITNINDDGRSTAVIPL